MTRLALAFLAAACIVVPVAALGGTPPPPAETRIVGTGAQPCGIAAHRSELWVGVYGAGVVLRLDARGRVRQRIRVGSWACRVAVDERAVWVTRDRAGELVRIDRVEGSIRRVEVPASPFDVLLAAGSLWTTGFESGTVTRLDPRSGRIQDTIRVGGSPAGLALCGGTVWVGHGRSATWLTAIDPATRRARRIGVRATGPGWPRCAGSELWVTTPTGVLRLDRRSGKVRARVRLEGTPAEAAAGPDGLVWVTDKERSLVHRIHAPRAKVVSSFSAGPGAYSLARVGGSMWITSFAGADVRRYDP